MRLRHACLDPTQERGRQEAAEGRHRGGRSAGSRGGGGVLGDVRGAGQLAGPEEGGGGRDRPHGEERSGGPVGGARQSSLDMRGGCHAVEPGTGT